MKLPQGLVPQRRLYARSRDGGETFYEEGCHAELFDGPCNAGQTAYSWGDDGGHGVLLFTAPANRQRTRLTGYVSRDGGRTWTAGNVISEQSGGYSDVAVLPDKTILTLYESQQGLLLARYNLDWLLGKNEGSDENNVENAPGTGSCCGSRRSAVLGEVPTRRGGWPVPVPSRLQGGSPRKDRDTKIERTKPRLIVAVLTVLSLAAGVPAAEVAPDTAAKTVRLLTVGNSFSRNATRYLADLATAGGHELIHRPIVVGGASLQLHAEKAQKHDQDAHDKAGLYANGRSLQQELAEQPWDFVTIQQASLKSHDLGTYRPYAGQLCDYIRKHAPGRNCWYTRRGHIAATTRGSQPSRRSPANRPRNRRCIRA